MTTDVQHTDVAAYALGLLEEDDRRAFEAHLAQCTLCTEELGDFAGMAAVFADVSPVTGEEDAGGGQADDMLRRRRSAARGRRRGTALLGAAAGVVLLAGGVVAGALTAHDPADPLAKAMPGHSMSVDEVFTSGEKVSAADAKTGVTGTVAMLPAGWGTDVGLELSRVRGPLVCELVAVSRTGERRTVTDWTVPAKGYGFPGTPAKLQVHGGTAFVRADIARFDVQVEGGGRTLLSIPVQGRG
jgi:hypothetical protein